MLKFKLSVLLTFVLTLYTRGTMSANILFYFGVSTYSHRIIAWPLVEALVERNHSVTFFQPYKNKNPNPKVTEVNPQLFEEGSNHLEFLNDRLELGFVPLQLKHTYRLPELGLGLCDAILKDPKTLEWLNKSKFDLIVIDALFNECAYGIAHKMKAKTVVFCTSHPLGWLPDDLGFPAETWWIPEIHFSLDLPLNFINRIFATLSILYFNAIRHMTFPSMEEVLRKRLDLPDMPSIPEMMANTSLMLTNTHFSEELARSLPPSVVSVGGMNCIDKAKLKPITKEMEDFIKGSGDAGFVLVSFGSGVKISDAPEELQNVFFKAFSNLKIRFILKWEKDDKSVRMPPNVLPSKWIPQQELLAHPKIRAFITHGGLLSMHEAVCHQVPMIVIPVFAEQDYNGERVERTGRGITLDVTTITQVKLEDSIQKILTDERYKKSMVELSKRFMDRPQTPIETAVWWTEYVLRHEDTSFMRPLAAKLTWYQRRLIDVWSFLLVIVLILLWIVVKTCKRVVRLFSRGDKDNVRKVKIKVK